VKIEGEFLRIKYHTRLQWRQTSCATKRTGWGGWIAQAAYSSEGATLGYWVIHPLSVLPSVPRSHPWNTHQTPNHACTKQDTGYTMLKTARAMSSVRAMFSLKTSSFTMSMLLSVFEIV